MLRKYYKSSLFILLPAWVVISFAVAQLLTLGLFKLLVFFKVVVGQLNETILQSLITVLVYLLTIIIAVAIPWLLKKKRTSLSDLGINKLPTWTDIILTPAGFVVYLILSASSIYFLSTFLPWFDNEKVQQIGFSNLNQRYEYLLAFAVLVVLAPIAEELLFRGYLFRKLLKIVPSWLAILSTSLLFALLHIDWSLSFQDFNLGIIFCSLVVDTFCLSIILCWLVKMTNNIWPAILLHMLKNSLAFYILFINPLLLGRMG